VKVRHDEGVANRIGPEPCAGAREGTGEASVGECIDQPLRRAGAKGNASERSTHRTRGRERVSQALDRVRKAARLRKEGKFTALPHHINVDLLREAFFALKRDAAPGVDGMTWRAYGADLELKLTDLASRVHRGAYRALPSRRPYIPKADRRQRPLAVAMWRS
jgi:RNA-directed DNA polymerase